VIALDTNVLVRYLVQDDPKQAALANRLLEHKLSRSNPGYVSLPVVCELVWTLRSAYGQTRKTIGNALVALLATDRIEFEAPSLVAAAISDEAIEITDALVHHLGVVRGCSKTVTFDQKFAKLSGVELLRT
jgi:predicted nucleic-acid-binding protein